MKKFKYSCIGKSREHYTLKVWRVEGWVHSSGIRALPDLGICPLITRLAEQKGGNNGEELREAGNKEQTFSVGSMKILLKWADVHRSR